MLRWALGFSLQYRFIALACASALIFFGAYRLRDTPVDVLPEFSAPIIQIQTEALGLSTAEVEDLVTLNLEEILTSVSWLKTIRSKSMTGLSSILLVFDPGTDLMRARQLVQERLNLAHALPNVSKPPVMLQPLSTTSRAMMVGLSSKDVSLIDASVLARWTIMPKVQGVPGVANVSAWGLRSRQLQVQVDQKQMQDRRVSLSQVIKSTGEALWVSPLSFLEASTPGAGGWIDTPNQRLGIQHVQPITTPGDLAKVSIADTLVNLGDVAKVVEGHPPLIGDAVINNGPGLLLVIEKFPHVSALGVVRGVDAALNELRQGLPGIEIDASIFRSTNFVDLSFANLGMALLIGGGLLILVLSAGSFTWRAALISIVAIVLSLVTAGLVFYLRGVTTNMMVVAGFAVALAAVIDDAIIDTDNILRRLRRHMSQRSDSSTATAIFEACLETRSPIAYAALILVLAVTPLFLISGPLGAFLSPFAISFVVALLASMAVAITVTPALAMVLLRNAALDHPEPPLLRWLQPRYEAVLSRAVRAPRLPVLVAGAFMLAGLAVLPLLNWSLLPSFKERDVVINWKAASGTSLPEMRRIVTRAGEELRLVPGIRNVATHIGRAVSGDQVVGIEAGQIWVSIDANAKYDATLAAIRETVQGYPGIDVEVQTYLAAKMKEILTSAVEPIVVRIQGPEREQLRREAEKVAKTLSGISGLNNLRLDGRVEAPHVEIEVNLAAAGRVGLKPGDVRRAAATFFAGLEVGNLFEQQKVFDVVVWGAAESRQSLTNIRELLVDTPNDGSVPLSDIADVRLKATPIVYERSDVSPHIDIRADVAGRDVASIVKDVKERLQKIEFPLEYHPVLLKDYAERQAAHWPILIAALAAVVGIFLLLHAYFQSWRLASLVCLSLLAALLGGVLALFAAGGTVFLGSLAGGLAVLGVAVRNGILLISRYQSLEREDGQAFGPELVLSGARERLGPIATSATAIGVAVLPVMVLGDIAGLEILHPMAVVILGGLIISALINLFVVPALYLSVASPQPEMQPYGSEQHA